MIAILLPEDKRELMKWSMAAIAAVTLALSIYVFVAYDNDVGGYQFMTEKYHWLPGLGVTFHLAVDGIATPMVLLTGIVMVTAVFMAWNMAPRAKDFFALLMVLVCGVYGVFLSLDLFFLFFFYELAVVPMYLLIGVWGSTRKEYGALKLVLYLVASSVLVWVGLIAIYVEAGIGTFNLLELEQAGFDSTFQRVVFPLLMFGFGVLAGLWPFHTWSPDGHAAAPTSVSMLHAGVLMKLGRVRNNTCRAGPAAPGSRGLAAGIGRAGDGERGVWSDVGAGAEGHEVHHRLFQREPHGLRADGHRHPGPEGLDRRGLPDVLPRDNDGPLLRPGRCDLRPGPHPGHLGTPGTLQAYGGDCSVLCSGRD